MASRTFFDTNLLVHVPPLRERPEDILPLAEAFLEEIGAGVARRAEGLSRQAEAWLLSHSWPGNVRELRNVLERATIARSAASSRVRWPVPGARLSTDPRAGGRLPGAGGSP